jgi:hypothetical protein
VGIVPAKLLVSGGVGRGVSGGGGLGDSIGGCHGENGVVGVAASIMVEIELSLLGGASLESRSYDVTRNGGVDRQRTGTHMDTSISSVLTPYLGDNVPLLRREAITW